MIVKKEIYRSEYYKQRKGSKTVKCEFQIRPFENKYHAFVIAEDENLKKGTKEKYNGNSLHGTNSMDKKELLTLIDSYTHFDEVRKDYMI